ncbi:transcription termination/antitermination protein NusG [Rhizorhabdus histidinilytica]|uniref:transcription termination/antitermination protein NusG n=1 Tax=Rhizorhabdus histidinilytica TaxID=439228 RepID=UPI001C37961F|nr:transcription termination/antitermination NusG family protein [Rhizorhabdus histidinilytica]
MVQLKPNAEVIAKRNLLRQHAQVFTPFEEITSRRAGRLVQIYRALFPDYLFVSFDPDVVRWRAVNSTLGVNRLIDFSHDRPAQVPSGLISSLMRRCDPSGKLLPPRFLRGGDLVRVTSGPLAEFIGTVEQLAPDQRVWVLLDMLGKNTRVAVKPADLRLAC